MVTLVTCYSDTGHCTMWCLVMPSYALHFIAVTRHYGQIIRLNFANQIIWKLICQNTKSIGYGSPKHLKFLLFNKEIFSINWYTLYDWGNVGVVCVCHLWVWEYPRVKESEGEWHRGLMFSHQSSLHNTRHSLVTLSVTQNISHFQ